MYGRRYRFKVYAEASDGSCGGLDYSLNDPPQRATMTNSTDNDDCDHGEVQFLPAGTGTFSMDISVTDGTNSGSFGLFDVEVADALEITPKGYTFLREQSGASVEQLQRDFEVTGGTPKTGSLYYDLQILKDGNILESDVVVDIGGEFKYTFDTSGVTDGEYFIRVIDKRGFQTVSKPINIETISLSLLGSHPARQQFRHNTDPCGWLS